MLFHQEEIWIEASIVMGHDIDIANHINRVYGYWGWQKLYISF